MPHPKSAAAREVTHIGVHLHRIIREKKNNNADV